MPRGAANLQSWQKISILVRSLNSKFSRKRIHSGYKYRNHQIVSLITIKHFSPWIHEIEEIFCMDPRLNLNLTSKKECIEKVVLVSGQ